MIPSISISNGKPAILLPLTFVISVSAFKDFLEDLGRHRSDDLENNSKILIGNKKTGKFE